MKRILSKLLLVTLLLQFVFIQPSTNNIFALDWDGTNNLDLTVSSNNTITEILWDNFRVDFSLVNANTS